MTLLADGISVGSRFARSANLERDIAQSEPLDGYVVTARALDVIERITSTAATGAAGGAWSLTGPYGSGKSSLALLLDAALGTHSEVRQAALKLIDDASPAVGDLLRKAHRRHGTEDCGFHRGLVTAGREPLNRTVLWALHRAVLRSYGGIPSPKGFRAAETLRGALEDAETDDPRRTGPSPSALLEVARCLAEDAPLLLVIDEFGKNLEAIRDDGNADPYLLQQLAEAGQGSGLPIFVLTLQHLSFEDHMAGADGPQRREWAKVQGRFEDVTFVESAGQTRALIGTVFDVHDDSLQARINRWASIQAKGMRALGVADLADPRTVASCYPLHPLAALVLPRVVQPVRPARAHAVLVPDRTTLRERFIVPYLNRVARSGAPAVAGLGGCVRLLRRQQCAQHRVRPAVRPMDRDRHATARLPRTDTTSSSAGKGDRPSQPRVHNGNDPGIPTAARAD